MKKIIILLLIISAISACEKDTTIIPYEETLIVEGYLYVGKPVESIKLSKLIPISEDLNADYSVNNAIVEIISNEKTGLLGRALKSHTGCAGAYFVAQEGLHLPYRFLPGAMAWNHPVGC